MTVSAKNCRQAFPSSDATDNETEAAMEYEPGDHAPNLRQIAAAWVICLGVAGVALAVTSGRPEMAPLATAQTVHAAQAQTPDPCPLAGVRNPTYAQCSSDQSHRLAALANGAHAPVSPPVNSCS
jgi:hypothetical protein